MKTIKNYTIGYHGCHYRYFNFSKYDNGNDDFFFIEAPIDFRGWERVLKNNKVVYLELEEPNRFFADDWFTHHAIDEYFHKVISICPYTTQWLRKQHPERDRVLGFIPFHEPFIPNQNKKQYDVIYSGGIYGEEIPYFIEAISKFNYQIVSFSKNTLVTHYDIQHHDRLNLISETKISLVHNLLWPDPLYIDNIRRVPGYQDNHAFSRLDSGIVPQIKGRVFEAAFCRSLILCRKDPWNVIEHFFEPEKEFVYFDLDNLEETIRDILENFDQYQPVIDRAFQKAVCNFTTQVFYDQFLKEVK